MGLAKAADEGTTGLCDSIGCSATAALKLDGCSSEPSVLLEFELADAAVLVACACMEAAPLLLLASMKLRLKAADASVDARPPVLWTCAGRVDEAEMRDSYNAISYAVSADCAALFVSEREWHPQRSDRANYDRMEISRRRDIEISCKKDWLRRG